MPTVLPITIMGGGLAGLSLGVALRREGVPVTVLEAGSYPRHRVCGEFIAGLDGTTTEQLGIGSVLRGAAVHDEVTWFNRDVPVRTQRLPSPAFGLSRYAMDARLAAAFVAEGGTLRENCRAAAPCSAAGTVRATGRRPDKSPWIGLKVHLAPAREVSAQVLPSSGLQVYLGDEAYVGCSAVEGGRWNLCGFFKRRPIPGTTGHAVMLAYLRAAGLGALAERVAPFVDRHSFSAVAGLRISPRVHPPGNGLALGDSCGMIPPFTGDGMAMAFQSAALALAPLLAYAQGAVTWADADREIHRLLRRRFSLRLASASTLHSFLLAPRRQRWLAAAARHRLLPLRPLYALLH